jgi:hypothetical protein
MSIHAMNAAEQGAVPHAATVAFATPAVSGSDADSFIAAAQSLRLFNWGGSRVGLARRRMITWPRDARAA